MILDNNKVIFARVNTDCCQQMDLLVNEMLLLEDMRDALIDFAIYSLFIYNLKCVIYYKSLTICLKNRESPSDVNPVGLGLDVKGIKGQIYGMRVFPPILS